MAVQWQTTYDIKAINPHDVCLSNVLKLTVNLKQRKINFIIPLPLPHIQYKYIQYNKCATKIDKQIIKKDREQEAKEKGMQLSPM